MADNCITCDVAIVGSGFAGSLIAKELSQRLKHINVVILEAGPGIQPNINDFMRRFYKASVKVPESPYPPRSGCQARSASRRRQAVVAYLVSRQLEGSPASLSRSDEKYASLQEYLRTSGWGYVALARPDTEACAERFPHERRISAKISRTFRCRIGQITT